MPLADLDDAIIVGINLDADAPLASEDAETGCAALLQRPMRRGHRATLAAHRAALEQLEEAGKADLGEGHQAAPLALGSHSRVGGKTIVSRSVSRDVFHERMYATRQS